MSITAVDKQVLKLNADAEVTYTSGLSAAFGADAGNGDYKTLILISNASGGSANITIAKGDGPQAAQKDMTFAVANNKTKGIVIDSAYFKQYKGDYAGYYKITPSAAVSCAVVELPQ